MLAQITWLRVGSLRWEFLQFSSIRYTPLKGLAAMLFISRDTCSNSIANIFGACFFWGGGGGLAQFSRDVLQNRVLHRCACVKLKTQGGYRIILWNC